MVDYEQSTRSAYQTFHIAPLGWSVTRSLQVQMNISVRAILLYLMILSLYNSTIHHHQPMERPDLQIVYLLGDLPFGASTKGATSQTTGHP